MKRIRVLTLLFALVLVFVCVAAVSPKAEAATVASGSCGNLSWSVSSSGNLAISGSGAMPDYTAATEQPWRSHKNDIVSITMSSGVTHIGDYAFAGLSYVETVSIGSGVKTIGLEAFSACVSLKSVNIPAAVTEIGPLAFINCVSMTTCTYQVSAKLTTIGEGAFAYCDALTRVKLPLSTRAIGPLAYVECSNLSTLILQSGITTIGEGAFAYCTAVTSVTIPNTVTSIGGGPFIGCTALKTITMQTSSYTLENGFIFNKDKTLLIQAPASYTGSYTVPASVQGIAYGAFASCTGVTEVVMQEGMLALESDVFTGCSGLTAVTMPNSMVYIGSSSFYQCTALTEVVIPDSVEYIGPSAFEECTKLSGLTIGQGVRYIEQEAFRKCTALKTVVIPDSTEYIGGGAFSECTALANLTLGQGLTNIDYQAFFGCTALPKVVIPEKVVFIGDKAFCTCKNLKVVVFAGEAAAFGKDVFSGIGGVRALYLESKTTWNEETKQYYGGISSWVAVPDLSYIDGGRCGDNLYWVINDEGAFRIYGTGPMTQWTWTSQIPWNNYISSITSLVIEEGATSLYQEAFKGTKITELELPSTMENVGDRAFYGCGSLTKVTVNNPHCYFGVAVLNGTPWLEQLPDGPYFFGKVLFVYKGTAPESYTVPAGTVGIAGSAFTNSAIGAIELPDSLQYIGGNAFFGCKNLTAITIPDSVKTLGSDAFRTSGLVQVKLGKNLTTIGENALSWCSSLESITIPGSVREIGPTAFQNCSKLSKIYFEGDAPSFGLNAFRNVTATAYYPEFNNTWTSSVKTYYGGKLTWVGYTLQGVSLSGGEHYDSFAEALENVDYDNEYLILMADAQVDVELSHDLYVDLGGYDLSGTIKTNGYKVYGMDSTTDGYTCERIGYFNCTDENGAAIQAVKVYKNAMTENVKRYLAITDEKGTSFHRYYLGITHAVIRPAVDGMGYKGMFCGDEMVVALLDPDKPIGFALRLQGQSGISVTKAEVTSGETISLRIDNFDVENYGETKVCAGMILQLKDGTVIESPEVHQSLRDVLEQAGKIYWTDGVIKSCINEMITRNPIMKNWDLGTFGDSDSGNQWN